MRSLRRPAAVFIAIALAGGLAACGDDSDDEATTATTATTAVASGADAVDITMREYSYTVGGDLKPGGTIRLSNAGKEFHMMGLAKLKEGKTIADVTALLQQFAEGPPGGEDEGPTTTAGAGGGATTTTAAGAGGRGGGGGPVRRDRRRGRRAGQLHGPGPEGGDHRARLRRRHLRHGLLPPRRGGGGPRTSPRAWSASSRWPVTRPPSRRPTPPSRWSRASPSPDRPPSPPAGTCSSSRRWATPSRRSRAWPSSTRARRVADINRAFEAFEQEDNFALPVNAAATFRRADRRPLRLLDADDVYLGVDLTAGTYAIDAHDTDVDDRPWTPSRNHLHRHLTHHHPGQPAPGV